jgi:O-antigen/teichoic acid export membrane protein
MSTAAVISAFTLSGMALAIKKSVAQGNDGALRHGFGVKLLWSGTIVLLCGCVSAYYFLTDNILLGKAFIIVGLFAPFIESFSLYKAFLTGKQLFRESAMFGFWRKPIVILAVLVALALTNDPLIILFVFFLSNALSVASLYYLVLKKYQPPLTKDANVIKYSKHMSLLGIMASLGNNADKILIFTFLGPHAVAIYSFAILPVTHFLKLFGFVSNDLMFPKFAKQSFLSIEKDILRKVGVFFLISISTIIIYTLSAEFIFKLIFPAYPEAIILSQVAILTLLTKPNTLFGLVFTAHAYKKNQYFLTGSTNILKVVSLIITIPIFGLWGAIWTFILVNVYWSIAVVSLFYYQKAKLNS